METQFYPIPLKIAKSNKKFDMGNPFQNFLGAMEHINKKSRNYDIEKIAEVQKENASYLKRIERQKELMVKYDEQSKKDKYILNIKLQFENMISVNSSSSLRLFISHNISSIDDINSTRSKFIRELIFIVKNRGDLTFNELSSIVKILNTSKSDDFQNLYQLFKEAQNLLQSMKDFNNRMNSISSMSHMELVDYGMLAQQINENNMLSLLESPSEPYLDILNTFRSNSVIVQQKIFESEKINKSSGIKNNKNPNSAASVTFMNSSHGLFQAFPYFKEVQKSIKWVHDLENSVHSQNIPHEVQNKLESSINLFSFTSIVDMGGGKTEKDALKSVSLSDVLNVNNLLNDFIKNTIQVHGSQLYLKIFIILICELIEELKTVKSEQTILLYSVIVSGMLRPLPTNLKNHGARIISSLLTKSCNLIVPIFLHGTPNTEEKEIEASKGITEEQYRLLLFYASLIGMAQIPIAYGWKWLVRAGNQINFLIVTYKKENCPVIHTSLESLFRTIRAFLRMTSNEFLLAYQNKFIDLIQSFKQSIDKMSQTLDSTNNDELLKLSLFIEGILEKKYYPPCTFRSLPHYVIESVAMTRNIQEIEAKFQQIEKDRGGEFMVKVKSYQLDRLRVVFNKLSNTIESQSNAVNSLLNNVLVASKDSVEMVQYVLYKITFNILTDCQEEFFNENDEGNPNRLAKLTCSLCSNIEEFSALIQAQFFNNCPLCIPKFSEEGLSDEKMLEDMGFKKKILGSGQGHSWENKTSWLARMSKMLCTYFVILIQPEQKPLSYRDGWQWLVRFTNSISQMKKPPFYTATCLEVFLRVTSQHLFATYGQPYLRVVQLIQRTILPKLDDDMPRKSGLAAFLERFVKSNGEDFMSLFS